MGISYSQSIARTHIGSIHSSSSDGQISVISSNSLVSNQSSKAILSTPFVTIIQEQNSPVLKIYPNPSKDIVYCSFNDESIVRKIRVLNTTGEEIEVYHTNKFKVESLSSGTYVLEVYNEAGKASSTKLNVIK